MFWLGNTEELRAEFLKVQLSVSQYSLAKTFATIHIGIVVFENIRPLLGTFFVPLLTFPSTVVPNNGPFLFPEGFLGCTY